MFDIDDILNILPHRYPFLMVDRIVELEPGKRVVGLKNVTINENFFQGHYPDYPIMPGVLILECMAQVSGFILLGMNEHRAKTPYFTGIDKARFRRPVRPGDQLRIESRVLKLRGSMCKVRARALVDGELAAEAELMFAVQDKEKEVGEDES